MATNDRDIHGPNPSDHEHPALCARLTTSTDGTTELTLYPADVPSKERITTWISASEGSFVDFEALR